MGDAEHLFSADWLPGYLFSAASVLLCFFVGLFLFSLLIFRIITEILMEAATPSPTPTNTYTPALPLFVQISQAQGTPEVLIDVGSHTSLTHRER